MIEATLRNYVLEDPDVRLLVGERIYPLTAPEGATYPLVVFRRSATARQYHMTGSCGESVATFTVSVMAEPRAGIDQYLQIKNISEALRLALDGYTQRLPSTHGTGSTRIKWVQITAESDETFPPAHAEGQDSMGVSMTLDVAFSEPVRQFM